MSGDEGRSAAAGERPWMAGNLRVARAVLEQVEAEARAAYPSECCGFLSGPASDAGLLATVHPAQNEADKYHALDPVTFPRTSREYFKINELKAARAFEEGDRAGEPIKVIYHSHCDAGAYFSEEDAMTFASHGQLMWPCAFLVVSVIGGAVKDRKLWVHVPGTNGFREGVLEVGP